MTKSKMTSKTFQKFDFRMKPNITTFPTKCFYITAMHLVCCYNLPVWRRSLWRKVPPLTKFDPALDSPLGRKGRKTALVRDLEYFIHTKFHQNPSSSSWEEVEKVNSLTDGRRTDDGRQTDGRTMDDRRTDGRRTPDNAFGSCALKIP